MRPQTSMQPRLVPRIRFLFLLLSVMAGSCFAAHSQSPTCSVKADQLKPALDLYGLHLGMATEEVKKALPLVQFGRADRLGVMRTSFNPHFDPRIKETE